jgi:asparagine synthase (glutamine-hydrolysing)
MQRLAAEHLSDEAVGSTGLLDPAGVRDVFHLHDVERTTSATRVQLDAIINHMIGVQILHKHFVATDVPAQARARAQELGWH